MYVRYHILFFRSLCLFSLIQFGCRQSQEHSEKTFVDQEQSREHIRTTEWQTPEEEQAGFQLPSGFEITLFASEPNISKPINMEFDARGRLWVTQSSEYPFAAEPGKGRDKITILEDIDRDGRADTFVNYVDTLNIPIGIMPLRGEEAVAFSIPKIYKFTDRQGDTKAEEAIALYGDFGNVDTHGMVNNFIRSFDGWIHSCHGLLNTSTITGTDGHSIRMVGGSTFRFLPDGSRVELTTMGRANPFGLTVDEWGYFYSADSHSRPIYQLIRGGEYPQFGIGPEPPSIGFAPQMMDYDLGPTAIAGLVYYSGDQFPEEYNTSFFSGNPASSRVNRNTIEFVGSTPVATREEDFMISSDPWFRPVDFEWGPDGSLYIADFYNRIIGHYEVSLNHPGRDRHSGRIWKVTYVGNDEEKSPVPHRDWSTATLDELVQALDHPVLNIRLKIANELVERFGKGALVPVRNMIWSTELDSKSFIQGLWILYRLEALTTDMIRQASEHGDPVVRVHSLRILAEQQTLPQSHRVFVLDALKSKNAHEQRAAVEVLSQFPDMSHVEPLLALNTEVPNEDTHLKYTVLLSLRHQLQEVNVMQQVAGRQWKNEQELVLMNVIPDVASKEAALFALDYLQNHPFAAEELESYIPFIGRYLPTGRLESVIRFFRERFSDQPDEQYSLHEALKEGLIQRGGEMIPSMKEWGVALANQFLDVPKDREQQNSPDRLIQAAELIGEYEIAGLEPSLKEFLTSSKMAPEIRTSSASALLRLSQVKNTPLVAEIIYDPNEPLSIKEELVAILSEFPSSSVLVELKKGLEQTPQRLKIMIASALAETSQGIDYLLEAIDEGHAGIDVLSDPLVQQTLLANIGEEQLRRLEEFPAWQLSRNDREQLIEKRLENFDPSSVTIQTGRNIFEQYCMMCHQVGNQGNLVGPQLDGIGNRGTRALAEKILDPNRNVSEAFRIHRIHIINGRVLTGMLKREEGAAMVFVNMSGEEFVVAKSVIERIEVSGYSLMPEHFGEVLDQQDFNALLKYLLSLK